MSDSRGGTEKIQHIKIPYHAHPWQRIVHNDRSRFRVIPAGRKFGKTTLCIREAFDYLGAKNSMVWWCAPYQQVANLGYRRFLQIVPGVLISSVNKKDHQVTMINGSVIQFKSTENEGGLVGEGLDLLIMDEASRVKEKTWQETIRPNLDDPMRKGHCVMISTPQGFNWFYEAWMLGQQRKHGYMSWAIDYKKEDGGVMSWKNPYFTRENLIQAHQLPKQIFMQEYGARFLRNLGSVFRNVRGAIREMQKIENEEDRELDGTEYVAGVDWGRANDYTVVTIIDRDSGHLEAYDRFRKTSWNLQVKRVAELLRQYKAKALCDGTGLGDPVYDMLYAEYSNIRNFSITNARKQEIIDNLAIMIERGGKMYSPLPLERSLEDGPIITYPEIPELIQELSMFGMDMTPGGRIKYTAPRGFHDDFVISLALAAWQLKRQSVDLGFEFATLF